ncbi:MAG: protein-methionine-sulfoxide reductase catalytic subunit MsrP [Gammaproteobacteria bacterium]|nr:protein-methionine-sulfoxide reductase catalytic subunit MsrP [Gammaproteobacteria bacterium]
MLLKTRRPSDCREFEVTDKSLYLDRRRFIQTGAAALGGVIAAPGLLLPATAHAQANNRRLSGVNKSQYDPGESPTSYEHVTSYNNFYEFGTDKKDPANNATEFQSSPWKVTVDGHAEKKGKFNFEELLKRFPLEERLYRFRCVEAWSMVVPWVGFSLASMLKYFQPTSRAKYVEFTTLYDPAQMPGQRRDILDWPYVEGLRMDEAMHPLSLMVVGLYGEVLPAQNGAPLRLMLPWKYGFKSIKSIVRISFTEKPPLNTWQRINAMEYGFYANVNPAVDHPRWSQARERRLGDFFKRDTLMFNGYAEEVASLYSGMDLKRFF